MAKNSPRRSLRSLFSKREVNVDDPAEKAADQNEGEKKRFKFLKFRTKPKNESGPVKPVHENQQLLSGAEPNNTAEEGGTWADNISDNIASDNKFSLYGTAPRSKLSILPSTSSKELSYSELDLRKPKRISSFSFGFRRKKKNDDEESISRSTAVLHRPGSEEPKETPLRLSQMELDKDNTKMTISMSQPQLDISKKFDIPSPPPLATNQLDSSFTLPNQSGSNVNIDTQQEVKEPLTNGSALSDEHEEPQKAPIATIPELQLDSLDSSEEKETIPVHENFNKSDTTTLTEITSVVNNQIESIFTASQPSIVPDTSDDRIAVADSVITNNGVCDEDILQQSHTKIEISLTETTRDILSHHQPDAPDTAGNATQNGELSVPNTDSKIDTTITDSTPVPLADNSALSANSASVHQEVSISHTVPETAISVTTTSSVSKEKSTCPVSQETVYEALYDSLLPQSFTSEVLSSLSKPLPQIHTEIRHQEVSVSCTDRSVPETATSVTTTSSVSKEKSTIPANQDKVLPQSVASMEVSTLSSPPPQINTKIRHQEISISCTDGSVPETATSVRTTSSVCEEKNTNYGASYDSLLPQSFTSVEESSLSNPPPQFSTEIRRQEVSIACTDGSVPKTATSVTTTSSVSEERSTRSVSQATIYGALYNSLLPQSFTSGLVSAPSNPPPQISTEIREVSVSCNDGFVPQTATSVTTTSSVSEEKSTHPVSQDKNNGASYDPLLPQSFALEVVSPTSNPPPQISTEIRHESTRSGPIMVKTHNEHHTETNVTYSLLSTSKDSSPHRTDDAVGGCINRNSSVSEIKGVPATSRFNPTSFQPQQNTEIYSRYLLSCPISDYKPDDSGSICYSELTRSLSEVKSDSSSLIQDNVRSVSVVESPAPPASDDS
ncbi:mucin-5AC-like [Plectropomus leopardus]|uniref:mucin-5AC-like n=1 Tax=Plectropomus leopardus TaxID=160734 RepID=UPI001C4DCA18|nr:mucin-5AC-like [Plectropomus leopardus]